MFDFDSIVRTPGVPTVKAKFEYFPILGIRLDLLKQ